MRIYLTPCGKNAKHFLRKKAKKWGLI